LNSVPACITETTPLLEVTDIFPSKTLLNVSWESSQSAEKIGFSSEVMSGAKRAAIIYTT
jgi:hypothetical protein